MMLTTMVSWLFFIFATLKSVSTIQVTPNFAVSSNKTAQTQYTDSEVNYGENETIVGDSELSASERNRRLIPYMAFYLPPPEFPLNQQYLHQRPKQTQQQTSNKAQQYVEHAVAQATPGAVPIPTAYVHMKVPAAATGADLQYHHQQQQQKPQHQQHFPPSAGEVYHSIAYGGQHPIPTNLQDNPKKSQVLHATGPGHTIPVSAAVPLSSATHYKDINGNDHKSMLVYPASTGTHQHTPQHHRQQQQLPLQQQYPRQRPKQSKINLTPFTSSNTVPGHFIPVIYTPLSVTTNNDANIRYKTINHKEITDEEQEQQQQQQQQQVNQQHQYRQQKQQQQTHEIAHHSAEYPLPETVASSVQSGHPRAHQVQFLAVTATPPKAATAAHPPSRPIYHVFNEASESLQSQSSPSQQLQQQQQEQVHHQYQQQHQQLVLQQQQQQQEEQQQPLPLSLNALKQNHQHYSHSHTATHLKHSQFHPPKPENFFDSDQYLNADNMTPQEKYVLYLQQRLHYNKQQKQQRDKDRQRERQQNYKQQFRLQQQPQQQQQQYQGEQQHGQILVISSTQSPVEEIGGGSHLIEMQQPPQLQQQQTQQQQLNYPQYNTVGHAVYQNTKQTVPMNHHQQLVPHSQAQQQSQPQPKQHQQLVHIPALRPVLVDELDTQQQQHPRTQIGFKQQRPQLVGQYEKIPASAVPPHNIDYVFEEPKQSLEEEHHQHHQLQHPTATPHPTHLPPQAAYIVITTAAPHPPESPTRQHYATTPRPIYKNQPTLRLQPIKNQNERQPNLTQQPTNSPPLNEHLIPAKYVYVTKKPDYSSLPPAPSPTTASNHKPTYDYEEYVDAKPVKRPTAPTVTDALKRPTENYQTQQQQHDIKTHQQQHQEQKQEHLADLNQLPDIRSSSLAEILHKLQASNHLPQTLTPDNIDNSIKTLITILNNLKQSQTIQPNPPQHHEKPHKAVEPDYDYTTGSEEEQHGAHPQDLNVLTPVGTTKRPGPNTGRAGVDYPNYAEIPATTFDCSEQRYKGFFGDPETNCQVWHYCDLNGGKASFLCPNGTIFSQIALTCDWWFNVKCSTTSQLYVLNERLYKYILPFTPKFPEDYSGPIVDKYLALKFHEMEEKMRIEKEKAAAAIAEESSKPTEAEVDTTTMGSAHEHHSINSLVGEQSSERNLLIDDEVDDISQRGSLDTFESTTPTTSTTREAEIPLSLRPIVVSSTVEPEEEVFVEQNAQSAQVSQERYEDNDSNRPRQEPLIDQPKVTARETTKISVEKVEVIEIKSDGSSGHLTPAMIFNNDDINR